MWAQTFPRLCSHSLMSGDSACSCSLSVFLLENWSFSIFLHELFWCLLVASIFCVCVCIFKRLTCIVLLPHRHFSLLSEISASLPLGQAWRLVSETLERAWPGQSSAPFLNVFLSAALCPQTPFLQAPVLMEAR